ncbi:co-chaperone GroES [Candidatus Peregrinibacteria bacterium]|jgi:chaperonin GroES|nr:co-chaperone GroES [Candidatus Peregrinibacteria bacterium]MBT4632296.1 co-chaperone GroES [Candidatus Peregrinibacteria bacterium]MBT5516880.1 co-chaperone GroES [Candidatus Peregrinibacteria bacterium]MBT5824293.1 co-chaperone GroES [Candidatus Peregrinibacteria bacterium]
MANLTPLAGYVVVRRTEAETETASGIVLAESSQKEKPQKGEVISVGPGKEGNTPQVMVGQTILFKKYGPTEVEVDGEDLLLLEEDDIFAILNT